MRPWLHTSMAVGAAILWWGLGVPCAAEQKVYDSREETPLEYRRNLGDILPSTAAFDEAAARVEATIPR